ncbi:hypothetical protein F5878DRAFT_631391 [Lentinula raphanica]|uniref:Uncharacterized protein n=1 Tax=Lentinula raphanica TaxID=153919 RepID=A0AA38P0Z1_9AGAR|nr:hypothetical protein F5878DRAFT_631391 [Lentinula raphanica]
MPKKMHTQDLKEGMKFCVPARLRYAPYQLPPSSDEWSPQGVSPLHARIPAVYQPYTLINDPLHWTDPTPDACELYVHQAKLLTDEKQLVSFERGLESYVPWKCSFLGLKRLHIAVNTNQQVEPAYCHHIMNPKRDAAWCKLGVIKRHENDANLDIVGYMTPLTHICIAHPIYSANERLMAQRPLVAQYTKGLPNLEEASDDDNHSNTPSKDTTRSDIDAGEFFCPQLTEVTADDDVTFDTDLFVYRHPDLFFLSIYLEEDADFSGETLREVQQLEWQKVADASTQVASSSMQQRPHSHSRYNSEQAKARKLSDVALVQSILSAAEALQFHDHPSSHPLFNMSRDTTPRCLQPFLARGTIQAVHMRGAHLSGTPVGLAIIYLNGLQGLSPLQFCELRKRSIKCLICCCYFSFDGYQSHIEYSMLCQNTPELQPAPDLTKVFSGIPALGVKRMPAGSASRYYPALEDPVGIAWQSWNSCLGVTHEVWVHLITAYRPCTGHCYRLRTFHAHLDHFDHDDLCRQRGDEKCGIDGTSTDE